MAVYGHASKPRILEACAKGGIYRYMNIIKITQQIAKDLGMHTPNLVLFSKRGGDMITAKVGVQIIECP